MTTSTPPPDSYDRATPHDERRKRRDSDVANARDQERRQGVNKPMHTVRHGNRSDSDTDSGDSTPSETSTRPTRRKRTKHVRPKASQASRPRSFAGFESSLSSNGDSFLPTLGKILEGKPTGRDASTRSSISSTGSRGKVKVHHRHAHTRNGRIARSNSSSQAELQGRVRGLISPSLQSVLSSITAATSSSSGSNGSGSTVTQSSYTKSEVAKHTLPAPSQLRSESTESTRRRRRRHRENRRAPDEQPNVFAFMEEAPNEDEGDDIWPPPRAPSHHGTRPQTPAMQAYRSSTDPFVSPRPMRKASFSCQEQLHSDSGISVRGSSPESSSQRKPLKGLSSNGNPDDTQSKTEEATASAQDHIQETTSWHRRWSSASADIHTAAYMQRQSSAQAPMTLIPYATEKDADYTSNQQQLLQAQKGESNRSGYNLLASRLSDVQENEKPMIAPLYRKFTRLNHRILLHLQDELAEMEEQLQQLDFYIARCKPSPASPESRRAEAQYYTDLTFRRTELLGKIFVKTKQYNKALSSFKSICTFSRPRDTEAIEYYRSFTREVKPIIDDELRFLDHPDDLITIAPSEHSYQPAQEQPRPPAAPSTTSRPLTAMPALLLGPPAAMMVAFVLFSAATTLTVRAFLLVFFTTAGAIAVRFGGVGREVMSEQERWVGLAFYICLLLCVAATAG